MWIPQLKSQQPSAETAVSCGNARNISKVDVNSLLYGGKARILG
jgi:hypothetical protein